jgi:hypothetical protein
MPLPGQVDQQIRGAIQFAWMMLPDERTDKGADRLNVGGITMVPVPSTASSQNR